MELVTGFLETLNPWHWWTLGAALLLIEVVTPTFYTLWSGLAAILVGALLWFVPGMGWEVSLVLFGVLSVAATAVWHRMAHGPARVEQAVSLNERAKNLIGRQVFAAEAFHGGRGPVLLDDTRWQAVADSASDVAAGAALVITGSDGATLRVRPA